MNDITVLLIIWALSDKKSFNGIKHAIEAADSFNSKIDSLSGMMNMLPNIMNAFSSDNSDHANNDVMNATKYIDTLKDMLRFIT